VGDCGELGNAMSLSAAVHASVGDSALALRWLEEGLALWQRLGNLWGQAEAHLTLASFTLNGEERSASLMHLRQAFALLPQVDSEHVGVQLIEATAAWAVVVGKAEDSILLDAATTAQMRRVGRCRSPDAQLSARRERAEANLDVATVDKLQRTGSALSYRDALAQVAELLGTAAET
jgi:hypothetical protein